MFWLNLHRETVKLVFDQMTSLMGGQSIRVWIFSGLIKRDRKVKNDLGGNLDRQMTLLFRDVESNRERVKLYMGT